MADYAQREMSFFDRRHGDIVVEALRRQRTADSTFCDVTLNVRGRTIGAHAAVLAAVSPYFADFFASDLPRSYSQRCPQMIDIVVDGMEPSGAGTLGDAVEAIVEFIYSGHLCVNQAILARVAEIAGVMKLESAIHFCEAVLAGNLCSNQLAVKDGKLMEKADAKISTVDDCLPKDLKPVLLMSEMPAVLNARQTTQIKSLRPPTLVSVGVQVYPSLLDNTSSQLGSDSQLNTGIVLASVGIQNARKLCTNRSPLHNMGFQNKTDATEKKAGLQKALSKPCRQSNGARHKSVKLSNAVATHVEKKSLLQSQPPKHSDVKSFSVDSSMVSVRSDLTTETVKLNAKQQGSLGELREKPVNAEDLDTGGKFCCSFCTFSTNNVRKISEHTREHHLANNICYYCEQRFGSSAELSVHVENAHADVKTSSTPFVCNSCAARFRTRTQLVTHLPKHSSNRPFICAKCGASFKWRNALHDHAARHALRKDHLCDICGYATAHRGQLRAHRLVHTGGTMRCSWQGCDFRATRMQNLKYHLLTHTQEKPHQCDVCGQSFSLAKNLKRHMLSHVNSAAKHNCSQCSFSTLRYDKLKEHLHKQHKVGSAPERRVRITDLVNLDLAKTLQGSLNQPVSEPTQMQSVHVPDTAAVDQNVSCIDWSLVSENTCPQKQSTVVDNSVAVVEPADFLLDHLQQPHNVLPVDRAAMPAGTITMSSLLYETDVAKELKTV